MIKEIKDFSHENVPPIFPKVSLSTNGYGELEFRTTVCVSAEDKIFAVFKKKTDSINVDYVEISKFMDSIMSDINKLRLNYDNYRCLKDNLIWYQIIE